MKKIFILSSLIAVTLATPSFAEPTELDKKTVASKAYVDTKQDKIETGRVLFDDDDGVYTYVPALVSYGTGTNGTDGILGNKIGVLDWNAYNATYTDLIDLDDGVSFDAGDLDNYVPTVRFLVKEFHRLVWDNSSSKKSAKAIIAYNTTFGNGTNNWVGNSGDLINGQFLANSLALKQNKITTGLVEFDGEQLRPIVTTNASGIGVNGTDIAIIDSHVAGSSFGGLQFATDSSDIDLDVFIPTVGAVAEALRAFSWHPATSPAAINAYSVTFDGTTGNWPSSESGYLVPAYTFVNSLALKQNILPAKSTGNAAPKGNQAVVLNNDGIPSNVYTTAGKDLALTAKSGAQRVMNYVDGTTASATFATSQGLTEAQVKSALVSLELLKDVYSELNSKITNNALPTGTTGTVVTYNGTNATTGVQEFTETAMTGTVTYTNGTLDNANDIATITAVGTRQKKKECGGYEPAAAGQPAHDGTHPGDEDYCWLWIFPED